MKEYTIDSIYQGVKSDKFVMKILKGASKGFIYKMYRKKNIVLNSKKMTGNEILEEGDCIQFYFSDETFDKFSKVIETSNDAKIPAKHSQVKVKHTIKPLKKASILYEDEDLLVYNKESNILSQSNGRDPHLMESYEAYAKQTNIVIDETTSFGVCNRLDRNTTGVILIGKNAKCLRLVNESIMNKTASKFYHAIIYGNLDKNLELKGFLKKNTNRNKVVIENKGDGDFIHTLVHPISHSLNNLYTLVEVEIKTGKSHQIRAHLSTVGYPLIGDGKYGDKKNNDLLRKSLGIRYQMLHAKEYTLGEIHLLPNISKRTFVAPYSREFEKVLKELFHYESIKD